MTSQEKHILVIYDESSELVTKVFEEVLSASALNFNSCQIPLMTVHGQEPHSDISNKMSESSLILCLTKFSMAHTRARKMATEKGARFLSLPYFDLSLLEDESVTVDYRKQAPMVRLMTNYFTAGSFAHVSSEAGTSLELDIRNRIGNYCPGFVTSPGELGSPPDIESNVSPIENGSNGKIVVDGSITCDEFGLLETPIDLTVEQGKVTLIQSENQHYVELLENILGPIGSPKRVVAELGVGFNPNAKLTGKMLTDEGAAGHVHFGLGSNSTVGGQNAVAFHLDFVIRNPTLSVDNEVLLEGGSFCSKFQNLEI